MRTRATLLTVCLLLVSVCASGTVTATAAGASVEPAGSMAATQEDCSFPVEKTDATGETVTVEEKPERIVALQPSDAQLLWEIGAEDRVVGMARTEYTDYLGDRSGKTNVKNDDGTVNVELVVGQQPDLVLASNTTDPETVRELRRAGLTVYHFGQVVSLEEIASNVETTGELVGSCDAATQRANEFRLDVATVEKAAELSDDRPSVLYFFFGWAAGSNTHLHDMVETAGGNNVAADVGLEGYAQISPEVAVQQNPDWIVYPSHASLPTSDAYNETTAMQEGQTIRVYADYANQPGPKVAIPLIQLAKAWNPDALDQANETVTMDNVTTPAETTTQTSSSGPGFGIGVGVVALLAAALLARRE